MMKRARTTRTRTQKGVRNGSGAVGAVGAVERRKKLFRVKRGKDLFIQKVMLMKWSCQNRNGRKKSGRERGFHAGV